MKKVNLYLFILILSFSNASANDAVKFEEWKLKFKERAIKNNISEKTFNLVMTKTKYLPKVIEYDRYQPEFYEDTKTYISKRTSSKKSIYR